jgi:ankyrin repeat protein
MDLNLNHREEKLKEKPSDSKTIIDDLVDDNHASNNFPHAVCGPGNLYGRSPIHKAVCEMDVAAVHQELLDPLRATNLHRRDEKGYLPIHSACTLSWLDQLNSSVASEIARLLVASGADPSALDSDRNTPLHWAARAADTAVAQYLILRKCPIGKYCNISIHFNPMLLLLLLLLYLNSHRRIFCNI